MKIELSLATTKTIYRQAIDARASDGEGSAWWTEVGIQLAQVLAAATLREAAAVIAWWHNDWSMVGDTAEAAASRIRAAGAAMLPGSKMRLD